MYICEVCGSGDIRHTEGWDYEDWYCNDCGYLKVIAKGGCDEVSNRG